MATQQMRWPSDEVMVPTPSASPIYLYHFQADHYFDISILKENLDFYHPNTSYQVTCTIDPDFGEAEAKLITTLTIDQIRRIMVRQLDGHIMAQSVKETLRP